MKDSPGDGFKPSGEEEKKDAEYPGNEDNEVLSKEEPRVNQEKDANVNSNNNINNVSLTVNKASIKDNVVDENIVYGCTDDPNMPNLAEIVYSDDDEDIDAEANMTNLDTNILVSPIPTTIIYKDHPVVQIIRDIHSAPQTRKMTKNVTNHEPKKVIQALIDPSEIEAMQDELLQFKLQIEAIRLFLAYASFKDFVMYQMDVKSAFMYSKIKKEVFVCQPLGFEDPEFPDIVYKVEKALYGLHQAPRAWYETVNSLNAQQIIQTGPPTIQATIDKTPYTITEDSVRSQLQLADDGGIDDLPIAEIYSEMDYLGTSGSWDQFGSQIVVALICLYDGRRFNWSSYIFKEMVSNIRNAKKFLMYPRFLQVILGEGAEVAAQAIPQNMPAPDQPQDNLSTPPRQQTSNPNALVFEHGSFPMSPPGSPQAPPAGQPSSGAEDPITLIALSSVVSSLVHPRSKILRENFV
nr:hypothetical protein [Tanacetum cinerariifolium]